MASVSVDGLVAGWTVELVLRERLWSRSQFATATVGGVRAAGFEVLPTHDAPHFDVVFVEATLAEAGRLLDVFGPPKDKSVQEAGEAMMANEVVVDIPCDVQQVDGTGFVCTFLDEARDPSPIAVGAIVVTGDEVEPVLARVVSLTERPSGIKVHLQLLPGDPVEYADALTRAHLLTA